MPFFLSLVFSNRIEIMCKLACLLFLLCTGLRAAPGVVAAVTSNRGADDPSPPKKPADEWSSFQLEPGLEIQLVASEPMIQDPVVSTFDAEGRLWVVEMRGFMNDVEGKG